MLAAWSKSTLVERDVIVKPACLGSNACAGEKTTMLGENMMSISTSTGPTAALADQMDHRSSQARHPWNVRTLMQLKSGDRARPAL